MRCRAIVANTIHVVMLLAIGMGASRAQSYLAGAVTIVVPFAAGSGSDVVVRLVGGKLATHLKKPVIVDDRPGASGQIGTELVARAKPDGHTLLFATTTSHSSNPSQFRNLRYDPLKDFAPVTQTGEAFTMLVVNNAVPASDVKQLIAYARANPGRLSYAWVNAGHLVGMETLRTSAGLDMLGVPYKSSPQAVNDLVSGQVQIMFIDVPTGMTSIRAGKIRALAVATARRSVLVPDLPPLADTIAGFDIRSWQGIVAPGGTPSGVVDVLFDALHAVMGDAETRETLAGMGIEARSSQSPSQFLRFMEEQLVLWTRLNRQAGIKPD